MFEQNPKLRNIHPTKLRIINEIKEQSKYQSAEELLPQILQIYAHAREAMAASGNPTQWGDKNPDPAVIRRDMAEGNFYGFAAAEGLRMEQNWREGRGAAPGGGAAAADEVRRNRPEGGLGCAPATRLQKIFSIRQNSQLIRILFAAAKKLCGMLFLTNCVCT